MLLLISLVVIAGVLGLAWSFYSYSQLSKIPLASSYGVDDEVGHLSSDTPHSVI